VTTDRFQELEFQWLLSSDEFVEVTVASRPIADIRANWEQSFAARLRGSKAANRDDGSGFASERQVSNRQRSFGLRMPMGTTGHQRS